MKRGFLRLLIIFILLPLFIYAQEQDSVLKKAISHIVSEQHESGAENFPMRQNQPVGL